MLAGPLDYHQGSLRGVSQSEFRPQNEAPLVVGTPCRMLATYVVYQNHLPMMADYPTAYRQHPLTSVMAGIPDTWDDTTVLIAMAGQCVAIARRSNNDWWIGAMTNQAQRELTLPLRLLGPGRFRAEVYQDELSAPYRFAKQVHDVKSSDELTLRLAPAGGALVRLSPANGAPNWQLTWSDEFDALDEHKWRRVRSAHPTDNSRHATLPELVHVDDGKLVILSENGPADGQSYRSGQVISSHAQRLGRWEVRAKIPTTRGVWPAIQLRPDGTSAGGGQIFIMQNRGDQPTITSSAFRWNRQLPRSQGIRNVEQQISLAGELVSYPEGYHVYAVEWLPDQLRFFVDDVHHTTFYNDEVGFALPQLTAPMQLIMDTAIGGDFTPPPDDSTQWPQRFVVDWVRVYKLADTRAERRISNGDFESGGGTLAGWHVFGNRFTGDPNVLVHNQAVRQGRASLKLSGQASGVENYSGVSQGISVADGQQVRARLAVFVGSPETLAKSSNCAFLKVEFYDNWGDYFGGPALLGFAEREIANGQTPVDEWEEHELTAVVPPGAVEARLSILFFQPSNEPGAVHIDAVDFVSMEP
jgi:beta-glucanase (GH16 family)